jgi:hypothetical protein
MLETATVILLSSKFPVAAERRNGAEPFSLRENGFDTQASLYTHRKFALGRVHTI